jgi:hypothetical protein
LLLSALLRTALSALPFGGAVATGWNEWDTGRRFQNIENTIADGGKRFLAAVTIEVDE